MVIFNNWIGVEGSSIPCLQNSFEKYHIYSKCCDKELENNEIEIFLPSKTQRRIRNGRKLKEISMTFIKFRHLFLYLQLLIGKQTNDKVEDDKIIIFDLTEFMPYRNKKIEIC